MMLSAQQQHPYPHQQSYGHDQPSWQTQSSNAPHGLSHGHQHNTITQQSQNPSASQQQQHPHYSRIATNPKSNTNHSSTSHTQSTSNNTRSTLDSSNGTNAGGGSAIGGTGSFGIGGLNEMGMGSPGGMEQSDEFRKVLQWVAQLMDPDSREAALMELSKKREQVPELALVLWHSFGVMTSLLQEIISVYPLLNPSQLTAAASNRVCNALALLQCVASHNETRTLFLSAHLPLFLYPFLNTTSKSRPFEYLRLTSLGVIGALVKNEPSSTATLNPATSGGPNAPNTPNTNNNTGNNANNNQQNTTNNNNSSPTITFLLTTEIIPLCLRIMETGSELSKTVAIFIVQKILLDDTGLNYICATYERFYAVGQVLSNMVMGLVETQTVRLLKHVVRCFLRLSDNNRARQALRQCLPEPLRDATFSAVLRDDAATKRCLAQLLINLSDTVTDGGEGSGFE